MGARFAGSQHVGERRRRRLAVEADECADPSVRRHEAASPEGGARFIDRPHGDAAPVDDLPAGTLPITQIIPPERWKYAVGGVLLLALNGALLAAGWLAPRLSAAMGPACERIFSAGTGTATKWYSGLLLGLAAQLALIIWWARSRSLKDFDGRYWLWTRVAAVWLAFSGCIAVDGGRAAVETLRHFRPELSEKWSALAWLAPATTIGFWIARGLVREMRGCRASRILFATAIACYAAAGGFDLGLGSSLEPQALALLSQAGLLTGHAALFFSMWIHARHVIHCSFDPAQASQRRWRIPRPHFRMPQIPSLKNLRRREETSRIEPAASAPEARRNRERVPDTAENDAPDDVDSVSETPRESKTEAAPPKPRFRIDTRHDDRSQPVQASSAREAEPEEDASDAERDDDDSAARPDLRGMSKKQRRRILQELRDRERAARES